jgi:hypothetical protein
MAGDWMPVELSTPDKPEVFQMAGMLEIDPDAVLGKLLRVWAWFDQQTKDGNAPVTLIVLLDRMTGVSGFCKCMETVGWLEISENFVTMPNFSRWNGKGAKKRLNTQRRVAAYRARNDACNAECNASGNTSSVTKSVSTEQNSTVYNSTPIVPKGTGGVLALDSSKSVDLHPLHCRIIRLITPKSKCDTPRDKKEMAAWRKAKSLITEADVENLEWLYAQPKSADCDATWKKKTGVSQILNQFRDQADAAATLRNARKSPALGRGPTKFESI